MNPSDDKGTWEKNAGEAPTSESIYHFMKRPFIDFQHCVSHPVAWIVPTALLVCVLALSSAASGADVYPTRPIRIVHGYQAGNSIDINTRVVAERLSAMLGQQVVVEGKPGATGTIACQVVKESKPDGYTLLASATAGLIAAPLMMQVSFDAFRDFTPIAVITEFQFLLVANPNIPAKNIQELIALAKREPKRLSYASTGIGGEFHLSGELLCLMAGIEMLHVPYKAGVAGALPDLLTGRVGLMFSNPSVFLSYVRENKLRAIAVTGKERLESMPEVPTIAESGLPDFEMTGFQGILAPAGTPKEIIVRLNNMIVKIFKEPQIIETWKGGGQEIPKPYTPEEFSAKLRSHHDKIENLMKRLDLIKK